MFEPTAESVDPAFVAQIATPVTLVAIDLAAFDAIAATDPAVPVDFVETSVELD